MRRKFCPHKWIRTHTVAQWKYFHLDIMTDMAFIGESQGCKESDCVSVCCKKALPFVLRSLILPVVRIWNKERKCEFHQSFGLKSVGIIKICKAHSLSVTHSACRIVCVCVFFPLPMWKMVFSRGAWMLIMTQLKVSHSGCSRYMFKIPCFGHRP